MRTDDDKPLPRFTLLPVLGVAAALTFLLLLDAGRYGYHRDELYFLACARHLAWGFVDQPPLTPAIAKLSEALAPGSILLLRAFPALMVAGIVVLTGLIARELGAGRVGQVGASVCMAAAPGMFAGGHMLSTTTLDLLAWALVAFLLVRLLRTGDRRLWLLVGLVTGVALLNKWTILFLVAGLLAGLLATPQRRLLWSPWLLAGAVLAIVLWTPNLLWQANHGWPQLDMIRGIQGDSSGLGATLAWVPFQFLITGPVAGVVCVVGLLRLLRDSDARAYRSLAFAYLGLAVAMAIAAGEKQYYAAGLYPALTAAGAVPLQRWWTRSSERHSVGRWLAPAALAVTTLLLLPVAVPVLPASALATIPLQEANYDLGEQIGWPEVTADVARAWRSLPPPVRAHAIVYTSNYGEAGAIERFGGTMGLPGPYSAHNSYWWWATPPADTRTVVAVGVPAWYLERSFGRVELAGRLGNRYAVDNEEQGRPIFIATEPRAPLPVLWPKFRHYG